MRNRKSLSAGEESTEINISPLIDMVFILLIFFIVTTVFVDERGLRGNTPDPTNAPTEENDDHLVSFLVRKNGQVLYTDADDNTRDIGLSGVSNIVSPAMQRKEHPITINVEPEALMDLVVRVIDACETGGAKQVTMKAVQSN